MVQNTHKPYEMDTSEDADDPWEMIGGDDSIPFAGPAQISPSAVPGDSAGAGCTSVVVVQCESQRNQMDAPSNENGPILSESFISGVSSNAVNQHTACDVEDRGDRKEEPCDDPKENREELALSSSGSPKKSTDTAQKSERSEDPLVETLLKMGFEEEPIEKAIRTLRDAGKEEIDVELVISEIMDEKPTTSPLGSTWNFVESTIKDIEDRHQLRRRTQNYAQAIGRSAQDLWSNVRQESQRLKSNLWEACDQADTQAQTATTQAQYAACSVRDSFCRANEEHQISEKVAAAAVLGGAALLVLGNPRAGVGAMAVAGATLAAGEAMKHSSVRSTSTFTRDYGLNEGVHID